MPKYEIYEESVIYTDNTGGAILLLDELWYPFNFFDDGGMDIHDNGYAKPSIAYDLAKSIYT